MKIQKKYFSKVFFVLVVFTAMFTACSKDEQMEIIQNDNEYTKLTSDGLLKFDDFNELNELLDRFKEDEDFKKYFFKSKSNFKSLWSLYEDLSEEDELEIMNNPDAFKHIINFQEIDGEVYADFILDDSDFGSLLNQNGEVIIGDNRYKFNADFAEVISVNENSSSSRSKPEIIPITRTYDVINNNERKPECPSDYARRKRFKGSLWTLHIGPIYSGIGVSTTHYKRTAGIWWRTKTDELSLDYDVTFTQYVAGTSITVSEDWSSGIKTNERRVSTVFERCITTSCTWMFESANSSHYGKNGSNTWNCSLNI